MNSRKVILMVMLLNMVLLLSACEVKQEKTTVALAWHNNPDSETYKSTIKSIEEVGGTVKILEMVKSSDLEYDDEGKLISATDENNMLTKEAAELVKQYSWKHSNVEEVMKDIKCLILPGGSDFSPTLYREVQEPHGIKEDSGYQAERDVSDYILASYCIDNDIPLLGICRGMQVISVVSGADMIQDLGVFYQSENIEYEFAHRDENRKTFMSHDVQIIDKDSKLYEIYQTDVIEKVPSWHHQAVLSVEDTDLTVTGITNTQGIDIVEAVEMKDKRFIVGVQYHPEIAVKYNLNNDSKADNFMSYDNALAIFKALIEEVNK